MANIERIAAATVAEIRQSDREEDFGFTSLSGNYLSYELKLNYQDIIKDVNTLFLKNPIAARIVKAKTNYVVGDGLTYEAKDAVLKEVLDRYYNHPKNKWGIKLVDRINDLSVNGEFLLLPEVGENSGTVIIRSIYPGDISQRIKQHRYDDEITAFRLLDERKKYEVIQFDEISKSFSGDAFYFSINKPSHLDFGISDLFVSRDWLKMFDKSLYATMSRVGMILSFVWDVLIKTNDKRVIEKKMKQLQQQPPVPGSVRVHNDSEVWKAESPSLNGTDIDNIYRLLKGQCLTDTGTPEFVLGLGGDVNYATARAMLTPYFRDVNARQRYVEYMFKTQFDYVIWQAEKHDMMKGAKSREYEVRLPDPDSEKIKDWSDTIFKFSNSVILLMTNGIISEEDAHNSIKMLFGLIGINIEQENADGVTDKFIDSIAAGLKRIGHIKNNGSKAVK